MDDTRTDTHGDARGEAELHLPVEPGLAALLDAYETVERAYVEATAGASQFEFDTFSTGTAGRM